MPFSFLHRPTLFLAYAFRLSKRNWVGGRISKQLNLAQSLAGGAAHSIAIMQRQFVIVTPPLKNPGGDCLPPPLFLAFGTRNQNVRPKVISQSLNILGIGESTNMAQVPAAVLMRPSNLQGSQKRANSHQSIAGGSAVTKGAV